MKAGISTCQIWDCDIDNSPELKEIGFHSKVFTFIKFESEIAQKIFVM